MKISNAESNRAAAQTGEAQARILPEDRPKRSRGARTEPGKALSPLEKGMAVAEAALAEVPEVRDEMVRELKERIAKGEYEVSGEDIAEMMLRRRGADRIR